MSLDVLSVGARVAAVHSCTCARAHERAQVTQIHIGRAGGRCCCHMCTSCFQTTRICASSSPVSAGESPSAYTKATAARLPANCCIQYPFVQRRATCSVAASAHPSQVHAVQPCATSSHPSRSLPRVCACAAAFRECADAAQSTHALVPSTNARRPHPTGRMEPEKKSGPLVD